VASASSEASGYPASYAFNDNVGQKWQASSGTQPQWLKYDLGVGNAVTGTRIRMQIHNIRAMNFYIQASNNDSDWVDLLVIKCV